MSEAINSPNGLQSNTNTRVLNNIEVTEVMVQQGTNQPVHRRRRQISLEVQENSVSVQLNIRDNPSELNEATDAAMIDSRDLRSSLPMNQSTSSFLLADLYIFTESDVKGFFMDTMINYCYLATIILFIQMKILWSLSVLIVFIATWFYDLVDFIRLFRKYVRLNHKKHKKRIINLSIEKTLILSFKFFGPHPFFPSFKVLLYAITQIEYFHSVNTLFCLIPISLYFLVRLIMYFVYKKLGDCFTVVDFLNLGVRIFFTVITVFIILKYENTINWEWDQVFWSYWILFVILVGINVAQILMLITKYLQTLINSLPTSEIRGLVWCFILCSTSNIQGCVFVIGFIKFLEKEDKNLIASGVVVTLTTTFISLIICFIFKKDVLAFIRVLSSVEESESTIRNELTNGAYLNKTKQPQQPPEPIVIPKFLHKFSSTYFKKASDVVFPLSARSESKKNKIIPEEQLPAKTKHRKCHSAAHSDMQGLIESISVFPQKSIETENENPVPEWRKKFEPRTDERTYETVYSTANEFTTLNTLNNSTRHLRMSTDKCETIDEKELPEEDLEFNRSPSQAFGRKNREQFRNTRLPNEINETPPRILSKELNIDPQFIENDQEDEPSSTRQRKHMRFYSLDYKNKEPPITDDSKTSKFKPQDTSQYYANNNIEKASESGRDKSVLNCLICFDKPPDAVFMECGHGGVCYDCSLELWKSTGECYLCRKYIKQVLQIDLNGNKNSVIKVISATHMIMDEKESDT